jgi:translation elongation factor EF-Ts
MSVRDVIHGVIAKTGENIRVRRFVRFVLGQSDARAAAAADPSA